MKTYKIIVEKRYSAEFIVEANSSKEARELYYAGKAHYNEPNDEFIEFSEIIDTEEIEE